MSFKHLSTEKGLKFLQIAFCPSVCWVAGWDNSALRSVLPFFMFATLSNLRYYVFLFCSVVSTLYEKHFPQSLRWNVMNHYSFQLSARMLHVYRASARVSVLCTKLLISAIMLITAMQLYVFCSDELVKLYFEKSDNFEKNNMK